MNRIRRIFVSTTVALAVAAPFCATAAEAAPPDTAATTTTTTGTTTAEMTITVKVGDSLAGIAWRYGVKLGPLVKANNITVTTVIHPGDTLVIPVGATPRISPPAASAAPTTPATASESTYTVVAGDALAAIARRHGVKLGALVKANGIAVTSVILPGQQLRVPPATMPIPQAATSAATSAGAKAPVPPTVTPSAATQASSSGSVQSMLTYLTAQVGAPYRFFSAGPDAFDCSGLVVAGFRQIGITVPHQSRALARLGTAVDWRAGAISAGDLVFTSLTDDPDAITHVGVALDSRRWVQAVGPGRTVSVGLIPRADKIVAVQRIAVP